MVGLPEKDSRYLGSSRDKRPGSNQGQPRYREQMCRSQVWKEDKGQSRRHMVERACSIRRGNDKGRYSLKMGGCVGEVRRVEKRPQRFTVDR